MKCYIDGNLQPSNYFWAAIQSLVTEAQRIRLLNGEKLLIGGKVYQVFHEEFERDAE